MTWQSFFDTGTMDHRHLLAAYVIILGVNAIVFARLVYSWLNPKL